MEKSHVLGSGLLVRGSLLPATQVLLLFWLKFLCSVLAGSHRRGGSSSSGCQPRNLQAAQGNQQHSKNLWCFGQPCPNAADVVQERQMSKQNYMLYISIAQSSRRLRAAALNAFNMLAFGNSANEWPSCRTGKQASRSPTGCCICLFLPDCIPEHLHTGQERI